MLSDGKIKELGKSVISPYQEEKVQAIGYDLTSDSFYTTEGTETKAVALEPMQSVFVQCKETIALKNDMTAQVVLRNSRIRQGLMLTAPVYHPGHTTPVFFRVTNVSGQVIQLHSGDGIATVMFDKLDAPVLQPYQGTFQNEDKYRGMGDYKDPYSRNMHEAEDKWKDIKGLERSIYSTVLAIMAIFIAAFSIININVSMVHGDDSLATILIFNLCTLGAFSLLGFILQHLLPTGKTTNLLGFVGAGLLAVAAVVAWYF